MLAVAAALSAASCNTLTDLDEIELQRSEDAGADGDADAADVGAETSDDDAPCVPESGDDVCDGVDNDCDGQIDEDFMGGLRCLVGVGLCRREGQFVCRGGEVVCSEEPGEPNEEVCDGVDNDCDDEVDEVDCE